LDCDDPLPTKLADNWLKWIADLDTLQRFQLPRTQSISSSTDFRMLQPGRMRLWCIAVSLVAAKTGVALLKQQSLPRLELCAELFLSHLIRSTSSGLRHKNTAVFAWSESSTVLCWLSYAPAQLKTFVGNRTSEILDTIPSSFLRKRKEIPHKQWKYFECKFNKCGWKWHYTWDHIFGINLILISVKSMSLYEKSYLTLVSFCHFGNSRGHFDIDKSFLIVQISVIMAFELHTRGKRCAIDQWIRCLSLMRKVFGSSTRRCRVCCTIF